MIKKLFIVACSALTLFIASHVFAQETRINKDAQKAVDMYLKGMMLSDIPEGRRIIKETMWSEWKNPPLFHKHETLYEDMFETDIPTIKGYKRLTNVSLSHSSSKNISKRYLIIAYHGFNDKTWRVLTASTTLDLNSEVVAAEKSLANQFLENPKTRDEPQYYTRRVAYWYSLVGRLKESFNLYKKTYVLNQKVPTKYPDLHNYEEDFYIISKITGMN